MMDRLTGRDENGKSYLLTKKPKKYGFENEKVLELFEDVIERLAYYEDLAESGRLAVLPCKIGDTVYGSFQYYGSEKIHECKVVAIRAYKNNADSEYYYFVDVKFDIINPFYSDGRLMTCGGQAVIGKNYESWNRVFFTRKEAEAALKERSEERYEEN